MAAVTTIMQVLNTRKPSVEVTPITLATFLDDQNFQPVVTYSVSNSGLPFRHGAVTGFPKSLSRFNQSLTVIITLNG